MGLPAENSGRLPFYYRVISRPAVSRRKLPRGATLHFTLRAVRSYRSARQRRSASASSIAFNVSSTVLRTTSPRCSRIFPSSIWITWLNFDVGYSGARGSHLIRDRSIEYHVIRQLRLDAETEFLHHRRAKMWIEGFAGERSRR